MKGIVLTTGSRTSANLVLLAYRIAFDIAPYEMKVFYKECSRCGGIRIEKKQV